MRLEPVSRLVSQLEGYLVVERKVVEEDTRYCKKRKEVKGTSTRAREDGRHGVPTQKFVLFRAACHYSSSTVFPPLRVSPSSYLFIYFPCKANHSRLASAAESIGGTAEPKQGRPTSAMRGFVEECRCRLIQHKGLPRCVRVTSGDHMGSE